MITPNRTSYLRSLSSELDVQAKRIRDLIGDGHWGHDGAHKEALLGGLLQRHLPTGHEIFKGFVVSESDANIRSTEQDLLILDTLTEAPIFAQHGVAIAFPNQVRAAVSVKSQYSGSILATAIRDLASVATTAPPSFADEVWLGLYFFSTNDVPKDLKAVLGTVRQEVREIARRSAIAEFVARLNSDVLVRCSLNATTPRAWIYRMPALATPCFLARLLAWLSAKRSANCSFDAMVSDIELESSESEQVDI